jgi:outer membrane immunogenic protein
MACRFSVWLQLAVSRYWVAGFEIDLSAADIKGSVSTSASTSGTDPLIGPVSGSVLDARADKFDMPGSGRARLGYLATPGFLLYGTGGVARTRLVSTITHNQSPTFAGVTLNSNSVSTSPISEFGWVAGVDHKCRDRGKMHP